MNRRVRLPARFGRENRFELRPAVAPFRVTQETELDRLKSRLLMRLLERNPDPALNARYRRAANDAAALAWMTAFPLLFFPALLEEKAQTAERQAEKQREVYVRSHRILQTA